MRSEALAEVYNGSNWDWIMQLADSWKRYLLDRKNKMITKVEILTAFSNKLVDAEISDEITEVNIAHWDLLWRTVVKALIADPGNKVESGVFDWRGLAPDFGGQENSKIFSLTCNDSTEGMMALTLMEESKPEYKFPDKRTAYLEFIEVAPWNRHFAGMIRKFRRVGLKLISHAVKVSEEEGFEGRLGLHSKPDAESFYRSIGMTDRGVDVNGMRYFEFVR